MRVTEPLLVRVETPHEMAQPYPKVSRDSSCWGQLAEPRLASTDSHKSRLSMKNRWEGGWGSCPSWIVNPALGKTLNQISGMPHAKLSPFPPTSTEYVGRDSGGRHCHMFCHQLGTLDGFRGLPARL